MKKIVFSLLLLLGCGFQSHAQFNIAVVNPVTTQADTLDYALFRAQYMLSMRIDTVDLEKNPVTEEMMLEVGPSCSVFHSYTKYLQDSVVQADFANGASQEVIMRHMQQYKGGNVTYRLYKNYPTGKTTLLDRIGTSDLRCEEEAEVPAWTLLPETETILGYTCHKASCRFKGRDYEAWYTPEIPRGEGPWKLTGLPGLILRAEDTRDHYRYECTGIEQYTTPHPILYRGKRPNRSAAGNCTGSTNVSMPTRSDTSPKLPEVRYPSPSREKTARKPLIHAMYPIIRSNWNFKVISCKF